MNDKKKLIVVIALAVVVLGVGAFQFTQMSSEPAKPQATAKKQEPKETESTTQDAPPDVINEIYRMGSPRDPFAPGTLEKLPGTEPPVTKPEPTPKPGNGGRSYRPPSGFEGQQAPWNPLPGPSGGNPNSVPSNPNLLPIRDPDAFGYSVTGVITGSKPAAVFTDEKGNQRLVTLGGSLEEGSQLVAVEKGRVTVRHKGKTQTINVGGTPNVK